MYSRDNLFLIGHSIGAFMMLHVMAPSVRLGIGLCPTIERMAPSPQGQKMAPKFNHWFFLPFIQLCFWVLSILPGNFRRKIIRRKQNYPKIIEETISQDFLDAGVIWSCFTMANDEMQKVTKRPDNLLEKHREKLKLIYRNRVWIHLRFTILKGSYKLEKLI